MNVLTISQPFASLIAAGKKWVENRTWATPYRGPLAIHAGLGTQYLTKRELANYPTGVLVATCELVTCLNLKDLFRHGHRRDEIQIEQLPDQQRAELQAAGLTLAQVLCHEHCEGPIAWVLTEIRPCQPVALTGRQGLQPLPADLLQDAVDSLAF